MVRLGKTKGDLMIDMRPVSAKLRERAIRIVRDAQAGFNLCPADICQVPGEAARSPLEACPATPAPGLTIGGDVGVTFNEASGTRTKLRSYWSNQHTGLVDDVVFELQLSPQFWGTFTFE